MRALLKCHAGAKYIWSLSKKVKIGPAKLEQLKQHGIIILLLLGLMESENLET